MIIFSCLSKTCLIENNFKSICPMSNYEMINEIYTVSYLLYEFEILIKMLKFIYGTIRYYRILY